MKEYSRKNYRQEQKRYIKSIQKSLPLRNRYRKHMMHNLKQAVSEYEAIHTGCTITDLYQEFGTIEEVCESMMNEAPIEQVIQNMTLRRRITAILVGALILALAFIAYSEIQTYLFSPDDITIELSK